MTLERQVERERRRLRGLVLAEGTLLALAGAVLALSAGAAGLAGDRWLALPVATPWLVWVVAAALVAAALAHAARATRRDTQPSRVARAIEQDQRLRGGALRAAIEVHDSGVLGRRAAADLDARLAGAGRVLAPSLRKGLVRRAGVATVVALAAMAALGAAAAWRGDGWAPLAHPIAAARGTLLPRLRLDVPAAIVRGEPLVVRVEGARRQGVRVHLRSRGAAWREQPVSLAQGAGALRLARVDADLVLVATDGRSTSDTATVRVVDRPFVGDVTLRAIYPAYLARAAEPLVPGEAARLPQGTVIEIHGRASTALTRVALEHGGESVALAADGQRFGGRLAPRTSGRYAWRAEGAAGPIAELPAPLDVEIVPDSQPRIEISSPARDSTITPGDRVRLAIGATDDHGLAAVELRSVRRTAGGATLPALVQRLGAAVPSPWIGETVLDLASRGLEPGDELRVRAVAVDASPWAQRGESRELVLRVPSLSEQRTLARRAGDSAVAMASATAAAQKELQQRTADAARSRGDRDRSAREGGETPNASARSGAPPPQMSYQNAEQARAIAKEQRQLAERVQQLRETAAKLEQQLREAGALDTALASRMQQVQQLLKDALTPEMARQLEQLEKNAQSLQGDQARQSLADLAAQQRRLKEALDQSVEMLKRAALEGAMSTLRDEAKELAQQERALADAMRAGGTPPRTDSSGGQRSGEQAKAAQLGERSRDLSRDLSQLSQKLDKEGAKTGGAHAANAAEHAQAAGEKLADASRESAGAQADGEQGDRGTPGQGAQQAAGDAAAAAQRMQRAADEMAQAREQQVNEWKQQLAQQLDQSVLETLQLARQEQQLAQQAQSGAQGSSGGSGEQKTPEGGSQQGGSQQGGSQQGGESRDGGQSGLRSQQSALQQGTDKLAERLGKAAQQSAHVSPRSQRAMADARRKVADATREASDGRSGNGSTASAMRDAASALNQAAASLVRDRERLGAAQSASGFQEMMQRMQELAKQQGALAAQASGMSLMPGSRPGQQGQQQGQQAGAEQQAAARGMAGQQRRIADALDELGDADGSGKAEEMAAEARRLAQALERGVVDPAIIERQQRLFKRLLDAGRSLEQDEREDTGKREAQSATDPKLFSPENASASGRAGQRFRQPTWDELRGLSAEERRIVLEYFKRLNAEQP